jgi:hypothetical protein
MTRCFMMYELWISCIAHAGRLKYVDDVCALHALSFTVLVSLSLTPDPPTTFTWDAYSRVARHLLELFKLDLMSCPCAYEAGTPSTLPSPHLVDT